MSEQGALRIVGDAEIGKLDLAPGDILVVKVDRMIPSETADRIAAHVKPKLPDGVQVLVIDPAIELSVLTRAEIDAKTV
jgi:hypothetical protein